MHARFSLVFAGPLAVAAATAAQGAVWVVDTEGGPGSDFTTIQAAADVAADGDTLLVRSGGYAPLVLSGRSLTIVEDAGATATIYFQFGPGPHITGTPASGAIVMRGLDLVELEVAANAGTIWIEDAALTGRPPLAVEASADVVVVHSTLSGGNSFYCLAYPGPFCAEAARPALVATGSNLHLLGCELTGGHGANQISLDPYVPSAIGAPTAGASAAVVTGGTLWASSSTLAGGAGGSGSFGGGGLSLPCYSGGDGGHGAELVGAIARTVASALLGADGGAGATCPDPFGAGSQAPPGVDGERVQLEQGASFALLDGVSTDLTAASPVREGHPVGATVRGDPFAVWFVALASPAFSQTLPPLIGSLHVGAVHVASVLVADAAGDATFAVPFAPGALPGTLEALTLRLQGVSCSPGTCTLSPGSSVTLLDASF